MSRNMWLIVAVVSALFLTVSIGQRYRVWKIEKQYSQRVGAVHTIQDQEPRTFSEPTGDSAPKTSTRAEPIDRSSAPAGQIVDMIRALAELIGAVTLLMGVIKGVVKSTKIRRKES